MIDSFSFRVKYYKNILHNFLNVLISNDKLKIDYDNSVLFLLACDYNNVGDVLIRDAQEKYLNHLFHDKKIVVINYRDTCKYLRDIKTNATKNTIITLTGGGNTGDRYNGTENIRNHVLWALRNNQCRIIGFPQTLEYSNSKRGMFYLKKAKKAYALNRNFTFFAREKISYDLACEYFGEERIRLCPDIVFSQSTIKRNLSRNGIGLLLRQDGERALDNHDTDKLLSHLKKRYGIHKSDMSVKQFDKTKIWEYMDDKISFVSKKELVITDRLHGMILCYITNTPCIVFSNNNHKISETYKNWLSGRQNFIALKNIKDFSSVEKSIENMINLSHIVKKPILRYFDTLDNELTKKSEVD